MNRTCLHGFNLAVYKDDDPYQHMKLQPVTSHCPSQPDVPLIDRRVETITSQCDRGGTGMKRRDERSDGNVKRMEKEE